MADVLLVNPPRPLDGRLMEREDRCESAVPNLYPPASLCKIAGVLRDMDNHFVKLLDLNADADVRDYRPLIHETARIRYDYVIFRSTPETFNEDITTARHAKITNQTTKTIMLNWNMTPLANEILKENESLDYYPTSDNYVEEIRAIINQTSIKPSDFAKYPMPAWDLIEHNFKRFYVELPILNSWVPIETIEGCGLHCTFCVYAEARPKIKPVESVIEEFTWLRNHKVKYISFFDATFNLVPSRALSICNELEKINHGTWFCNIREDRANEELIKAMRNAGCRGVSCGVESGNNNILLGVRKESQSNEKVAETTKLLKKYGIKQYYSFVIGLPGETKESIQNTMNFILRLQPNSLQINTYTPYPKTPLSAELGIVDSRNYLLYQAQHSICDLTPKELTDARLDMYQTLYRNPGYWMNNISWCLKHPRDLKIGIAYAYELFQAKLGNKQAHCGAYWVQ